MKPPTIIALFLLSLLGTSLSNTRESVPTPSTAIEDRKPQITVTNIELSILLVQFTDIPCKTDPSSQLPSYTVTDFENLLGSEGIYASPSMRSPDGDEIFGSMNDYFRIMSGGRIRIHARVINPLLDDGKRPMWLTLSHSKQYYHSDMTLTVFDDAFEAARRIGLEVSTSAESKIVVIYAGNAWMGGGLNPIQYAGYYLMSERQGRPYGQEGSHARFSRIGLHCHEFAHTLGIGHSSGSRADLMECGTRNGSIEGNAPAPLNAIARMKMGWANVISLSDSAVQTFVVRYSLIEPTYILMKNSRGDLFLFENRRFDRTMNIGDTEVPDFNNERFLPLAWPHGKIHQGILVWRMNSLGDPQNEGYSSEGLVYASGRYGRTYPENIPSETDDGVPFPGVSNTRILSPWSDPRDPDGEEPNYFDSTRNHYKLFVPNTQHGSSMSMEIISEDKDQGCFTVRFTASNRVDRTVNNISNWTDVSPSLVLYQNNPNPFNPSTAISYQLPAPSGGVGSALSNVRIKIYNIAGQEIALIVDAEQPAGNHSARWDASRYPSGTYIYELAAIDDQGVKRVVRKKMLLLK